MKTRELENALGMLFPDPDEGFLNNLEKDLLKREVRLHEAAPPKQISRQDIWSRIVQPFGGRRWVSFALGLALLAAATVVAIGPDWVLAQLQHWVGYVPGIGFTELADAYALPEPVVVTHEGVTLHIEQVLAQPDRTVMVLKVEGLELIEQGPFVSNSFLLLPDGTTYKPHSHSVDWDNTILVFKSLPAGSAQMQLVWSDNFLRDWHQENPEEAWSIPLTLEPVKDLEAASLPRSYHPEGASDTAQEITIRVMAVSQDEDRTAVQLEMQWPVKTRGLNFFWLSSDPGPTLADETGHEYQGRQPYDWDSMGGRIDRIYPEGTRIGSPSFYIQEVALVFQPGPSDSQQLTLTIEGLRTWLSISPIKFDFTLDVGPSPQVGDSWTLDEPFEVGGMELRIIGARVVEVENGGDKGTEKILALELTLEPLPEDTGVEIIQMYLPRSPQRNYLAVGLVEDSATGILLGRIPLMDANGNLHAGEIRVRGGDAQAVLTGPWQISWEVPSRQH